MSSPSPQLPLGQVIGSRYRVQSLIGRGGMGMVYAATHELTGRRVALKLMLNDCDDSPILQERFLSEARIATAVRHPNIVDVLDMGLHGGSPFIVMELLEGVSLEHVLEQQTRLPIAQALTWLLPIVGALAVLHEAGIVHRDVKPSNIFMSSLPRHPMRPKLLDFGLARVVSDLRLTRSGTVIGTPLYMAPEHAAGQITGPQADVWSIGVVVYESLSGCSPFNYTDRASLAMQVIAGLVRPLDQVRPDAPPLISAALSRALHRDLSRRYPDMRSFAQALHAAAVASGIPVPADPDPIGLPEYAEWQRGGTHATTTMEQFAYVDRNGEAGGAAVARSGPGSGSGSGRGSSGSGSAPRSGSGNLPNPMSPAVYESTSASLVRQLRAPGRTRMLWLGLAVLGLVALGVLWRRSRVPEYIAPADTSNVGDNGAAATGASAPGQQPAATPTANTPATALQRGSPTVHSLGDGGVRPNGVPSPGGIETVTGTGATNAVGARTPANTNNSAPSRRRVSERGARAAERPAEVGSREDPRASTPAKTPSRRTDQRVQEPADEVESEWK